MIGVDLKNILTAIKLVFLFVSYIDYCIYLTLLPFKPLQGNHNATTKHVFV